ncbi:MAG: tetratricopeptide repeat protein [Bryobacteraceae bacterium]|nr:tetratricopeptide repeat protein [Bryobacteraceae bacterium]
MGTRRWLWSAAAAALILIALPLLRNSAADTVTPPAYPPPPSVAAPLALSQIQPPKFSPDGARVTGGLAMTAFHRAMRPYSHADWHGAEMALARVVETYPGHYEAAYFRAICQLLLGKTDPAIAGLDRIIALSGATPYEEQARFYRAQALLLANRTAEARAELERVIALHGESDAKAAALLQRLGSQWPETR